MNRLNLVVALALTLTLGVLSGVCFAQTTLSGALFIGRIETPTGDSTSSPSVEFNSTTWPANVALDVFAGFSGSLNLTGSVLAINAQTGLVLTSPAGDFTVITKFKNGSVLAESWISLGIGRNNNQGIVYYGDEELFRAYNQTVRTETATLTPSDLYLKMVRDDSSLTQFYSTDGETFTELVLSEPVVTVATAPLTISIEAGGNGAEIDYIRFTTP